MRQAMEYSEKRPKRPYEPPKLVQYGDLQKLTRNGLGGSGDGTNGGQLNHSKQCWIAEVLFGVDDPRTQILRVWLSDIYVHTAAGKPIVAIYRAIGRQVAALARRSAILRSMLRPLFERGLRRAQAHYMNAAA
jgi:hypothetical protein